MKVYGEPLQVCRISTHLVPECCRSPCALLKQERYRQINHLDAVKRVPSCIKYSVLVGAWKTAVTVHSARLGYLVSRRFLPISVIEYEHCLIEAA